MAILVLFKDKNSQYNLISKNENGFIVSKDKALVEELETLSSPDLDDDLSKSINIKNDTLRLLTRSEYVKGARVTEYIFRYQNNKFELIGLEYKYWHTSTEYAVDIAYSINFSTKKLIGTKDISGVRTDETKIEKVEKNRTRLVWGTKDVVVEKLKKLAAEFELEELMCIPLVPTIERRKNIIEILAKELMEKEEKN